MGQEEFAESLLGLAEHDVVNAGAKGLCDIIANEVLASCNGDDSLLLAVRATS